MTRWNPKKTRVHLALSTATKGLGLISEDSVRRRIDKSRHDLSEPISGDFLFKLFCELKRRHRRRTLIQIQKKSVQAVLKDGAKPIVDALDRKYDVIYCAGLFDYLPDRTCLQLMNIFYDWLAPGGLLATTNVEDCKPFRHMLEFVLDWHLIYRGIKRSWTLLPQRALPEYTRIVKDPTEVNVFIEVRKPEHG